jgi:hypothetical protein
MEEGVAQSLGFGRGEITVEQQTLGEGNEVLGQAHELDPAGVVGEVAEGQISQAGVFGTADAVFYSGMAAMAGFEVGDVGISRISQSEVMASIHAVGGNDTMARRSWWRTRHPRENSIPRSTRASANL